MPKIGFQMPTAKNRFQILNLHPKKHVFKKKMVLSEKKYLSLYRSPTMGLFNLVSAGTAKPRKSRKNKFS